VSAQTPPAREAQAPSGDAKRGKTLFDQTYRCYACHGYEGETRVAEAGADGAQRRVVPRLRPQAGNYRDAPPSRTWRKKICRICTPTLRSLHPTVPPAQNIPLLRGILEQTRSGRGRNEARNGT